MQVLGDLCYTGYMINIHIGSGTFELSVTRAPKAPQARGGETLISCAPPRQAPRRSWGWAKVAIVGAIAFVAGVGVASPNAPSSQAPVTASLVAHR